MRLSGPYRRERWTMAFSMVVAALFVLPVGIGSTWGIEQDRTACPMVNAEEAGTESMPGYTPLSLGQYVFDPLEGLPTLPDELYKASPGRHYVVQMAGTPETWMDTFEEAGADVLQYVPVNGLIIEADDQAASDLQMDASVRWIGTYQPAYKIMDDIDQQAMLDLRVEIFPYDESVWGWEGMSRLEVAPSVDLTFPMLEDPVKRPDGVLGIIEDIPLDKPKMQSLDERLKETWLSRLTGLAAVTGGEFLGWRGEEVAHVHIPTAALPSLAALPMVKYVCQWEEVHPLMDIIRQPDPMTGMNTAQNFGYNGSRWAEHYPEALCGVVMDNGIDQTHPDFANAQLFDPASDAGNNHGSSMFGIVFGSGELDQRYRGALCNGNGAFTSYTNDEANIKDTNQGDDGYFSVHGYFTGENDGWYDSRSNELDNDLWTDQAYVYVFGAGNVPNADGEHVTGEGCAKNVITVGGLWPGGTNGSATLSDDLWEHPTHGKAGCHGPTDYGALKPDLAMFYDEITTTANTIDYPSGYIDSFGGTSGACAIVAGCAGLFTGAWIDDHFGNNPGHGKPTCGATVKAAIINTADHAFPSDVDRYNAGWGYPHLDPFFDGRGWTFHDYDDTRTADSGEDTPAEIVPSTTSWPLRITLSWYDQSGGAAGNDGDGINRLVNDLNLRVVDQNNGDVYYGNMG
ncbi:MAG: S8 family serine peptidase, partial [Thermoplasmata archaeon]|nr:S8 family serine peptidase [Thermoplasmata archaeon]